MGGGKVGIAEGLGVTGGVGSGLGRAGTGEGVGLGRTDTGRVGAGMVSAGVSGM